MWPIQHEWKRSFKSVTKILAKYVDPMQEINKGLDFHRLVSLLRRRDDVTGSKNLLQCASVLCMHVGDRTGSGSLLRVCRVHFFQKGVLKMVGAAYPLQH